MVHIILLSALVLSIPFKKNLRLYKFSFVILFLFCALRYGFGNDYFSYYEGFEAIHNGEDAFGGQYLYILLNKIFPNFYLLIAAISLVYVVAIYFLMISNVPKQIIWLSMFILLINPYVFLINLSAIRQCIAMILFIRAIKYAIEKKFIVYICFIIAATLFHASAIILLPVYFIINEKKVSVKTAVMITAGVIFLLVVSGILLRVLTWIVKLFNNPNYEHYLNQGSTNSLQATLLSAIFFIYIIINLPSLSGKTLIYAKLYLLATILNVLAYRLSMLTRITMYFDVFSIVAIPLLIYENQNKFKNTMKNAVENRVGSNSISVVYRVVNLYVFPCLIILIYLLRYYSFFTNPLWESFWEYHTIFDAWNY